MMRLCDASIRQLEDLEALLSYLSSEHGAARFVYESLAEVKELRHVAKLETQLNVTTEQAAHIQRILSQTKHFMRMVPDSARKELDGG